MSSGKPQNNTMENYFSFFSYRHQQQLKFAVKRSPRVDCVTRWFSLNRILPKFKCRKLSNKMLPRNLYQLRKLRKSWKPQKRDVWLVLDSGLIRRSKFQLCFFFCQTLEAKKVSDWNAKMVKIEEASRKKDELNVEFITQTKEALDTKIKHSEEKREAIILDLKEKLKVFYKLIKKRVDNEESGN